jgi:hypothetical protein
MKMLFNFVALNIPRIKVKFGADGNPNLHLTGVVIFAR